MDRFREHAKSEFETKHGTDLVRYFRKYGNHYTSFLNFQDGVNHFILDGVGAIFYVNQDTIFGNVPIVFAKPLCPDQKLGELLEAFINQCSEQPLFYGVDAVTADVLSKMGFKTNGLGVEYTICLKDFEIKGSDMNYLRKVRNLDKKGLSVEEKKWDDVDRKEVEEISALWLSTKTVKNRELRLLTCPPDFSDNPYIRRFFCYKDGKIIAFVFFTPIYRDDVVIGYTANIFRSIPGIRPSGATDYIKVEAIKKFKEEGLELLALGISPLHQIQKHHCESSFLRRVLMFMHDHCNFLYPYKSLGFHKSRFRANESQMYICFRGMGIPKAFMAAFIASNMI